jgi:hypothetical protein
MKSQQAALGAIVSACIESHQDIMRQLELQDLPVTLSSCATDGTR